MPRFRPKGERRNPKSCYFYKSLINPEVGKINYVLYNIGAMRLVGTRRQGCGAGFTISLLPKRLYSIIGRSCHPLRSPALRLLLSTIGLSRCSIVLEGFIKKGCYFRRKLVQLFCSACLTSDCCTVTSQEHHGVRQGMPRRSRSCLLTPPCVVRIALCCSLNVACLFFRASGNQSVILQFAGARCTAAATMAKLEQVSLLKL